MSEFCVWGGVECMIVGRIYIIDESSMMMMDVDEIIYIIAKLSRAYLIHNYLGRFSWSLIW